VDGIDELLKRYKQHEQDRQEKVAASVSSCKTPTGEARRRLQWRYAAVAFALCRNESHGQRLENGGKKRRGPSRGAFRPRRGTSDDAPEGMMD